MKLFERKSRKKAKEWIKKSDRLLCPLRFLFKNLEEAVDYTTVVQLFYIVTMYDCIYNLYGFLLLRNSWGTKKEDDVTDLPQRRTIVSSTAKAQR